jgi:phosphohistidine phosphatase SixA
MAIANQTNVPHARLACSMVLLLTANAAMAYGEQTIFLLRHAERIEYTSPDGVLSEAGEARAQALARLLKDAGVSAIYTTQLKRTNQTAAPLATALGITPVVVGGPDSIRATLDMVRAREKSGAAVIIGHSNTVPAFLEALGLPGEIKIGEREHDDLFVIVPAATGPPTVLRLNY